MHGNPADLLVDGFGLSGMQARPDRDAQLGDCLIASAARTAWAGCSKVAKNPSPAVSTSRPRNRWSSRRTAAWWAATSRCHARSPSLTVRSVDPTISVKRIVARNRSGDRRDRNTLPATLSETWSQSRDLDEHRYGLKPPGSPQAARCALPPRTPSIVRLSAGVRRKPLKHARSRRYRASRRRAS